MKESNLFLSIIFLLILMNLSPASFFSNNTLSNTLCIFIILAFSYLNIYLGLFTCLLIIYMKQQINDLEGFDAMNAKYDTAANNNANTAISIPFTATTAVLLNTSVKALNKGQVLTSLDGNVTFGLSSDGKKLEIKTLDGNSSLIKDLSIEFNGTIGTHCIYLNSNIPPATPLPDEYGIWMTATGSNIKTTSGLYVSNGTSTPGPIWSPITNYRYNTSLCNVKTTGAVTNTTPLFTTSKMTICNDTKLRLYTNICAYWALPGPKYYINVASGNADSIFFIYYSQLCRQCRLKNIFYNDIEEDFMYTFTFINMGNIEVTFSETVLSSLQNTIVYRKDFEIDATKWNYMGFMKLNNNNNPGGLKTYKYTANTTISTTTYVRMYTQKTTSGATTTTSAMTFANEKLNGLWDIGSSSRIVKLNSVTVDATGVMSFSITHYALGTTAVNVPPEYVIFMNTTFNDSYFSLPILTKTDITGNLATTLASSTNTNINTALKNIYTATNTTATANTLFYGFNTDNQYLISATSAADSKWKSIKYNGLSITTTATTTATYLSYDKTDTMLKIYNATTNVQFGLLDTSTNLLSPEVPISTGSTTTPTPVVGKIAAIDYSAYAYEVFYNNFWRTCTLKYFQWNSVYNNLDYVFLFKNDMVNTISPGTTPNFNTVAINEFDLSTDTLRKRVDYKLNQLVRCYLITTAPNVFAVPTDGIAEAQNPGSWYICTTSKANILTDANGSYYVDVTYGESTYSNIPTKYIQLYDPYSIVATAYVSEKDMVALIPSTTTPKPIVTTTLPKYDHNIGTTPEGSHLLQIYDGTYLSIGSDMYYKLPGDETLYTGKVKSVVSGEDFTYVTVDDGEIIKILPKSNV